MKAKRKFRFEIFKEGQIVTLAMGESFTDNEGNTVKVAKYQKKGDVEYLWLAINGLWFPWKNGEKSHGKITNDFEVITA